MLTRIRNLSRRITLLSGLTHHIKARQAQTRIDSHMGENMRIQAHSGVVDPRIDRTRDHKLIDILTITLCAVICGAEHFTEIAMFGEAGLTWFSTFLELPNGIPSHDTFGRVLSVLDPNQFQSCFLNCIRDIAKLKLGEVAAIDDKCLRGSKDIGYRIPRRSFTSAPRIR
jgi:predicted transposase YbfD/YdcC